MHLTEKIKNDIAVINIKGDFLDENDTSLLQRKIDSLATDGIKKVVLDLSMIKRINSNGLSTLISLFDKLRLVGGDLRLARIDKRLQDILTITKLVQVFCTYETAERAIASYRN